MSNARNIARLLPNASGQLPSANFDPAYTLQAGDVAYFARNTAPSGYIKANGAAVSRTVYAALFAAIGTTFGTGDGSTTFNVPDLRGEFPRGFDDGRGVDSGRSFGSAQNATATEGGIWGNIGYGRGWGSDASIDTDYDAAETIAIGCWGGWIGYNSGAPASATQARFRVRPRNIALLACIKY